MNVNAAAENVPPSALDPELSSPTQINEAIVDYIGKMDTWFLDTNMFSPTFRTRVWLIMWRFLFSARGERLPGNCDTLRETTEMRRRERHVLAARGLGHRG